LLHADVAIGIGKDCGALHTSDFPVVPNCPSVPVTVDDLEHFHSWENVLTNLDKVLDCADDAMVPTSASALQLANTSVPAFSQTVMPSVSQIVHSPLWDVGSCLNEKQKMVHDIIFSHLCAHLNGENPPQRRLIVRGQGGTGKTELLNAIADTFENAGASNLLVKTAMSGVVAGIIGGQTLHTWAGIPITFQGTNRWVTHPSKEMLLRRKRNMGSVLWLTIDEKSMLTAPLLA
jgi:hypothetical protein